jgi:hypothetical protein
MRKGGGEQRTHYSSGESTEAGERCVGSVCPINYSYPPLGRNRRHLSLPFPTYAHCTNNPPAFSHFPVDHLLSLTSSPRRDGSHPAHHPWAT